MIFKSKSHSTSGFDTLIGTNVTLDSVHLRIAADTTVVVNGTIANAKIETSSSRGKTMLVINGSVHCTDGELSVNNLVHAGKLECDVLIVDGELTVKAGSTLVANEIRYNKLIIEPSAIITGHLQPISSTTVSE